jgi:hypothetical protein
VLPIKALDQLVLFLQVVPIGDFIRFPTEGVQLVPPHHRVGATKHVCVVYCSYTVSVHLLHKAHDRIRDVPPLEIAEKSSSFLSPSLHSQQVVLGTNTGID